MPRERGILRPLMFQAVKSGFSFNTFYASARQHDISYRRSDMLADWADVKAEYLGGLKSVGLQMGDIPEAAEVSTLQFTKPGFFYYRVKVDYLSELTDEIEEQYITLVSPTERTLRDILEEAYRKWIAGEYEGVERIQEVKFVGALHRPIP